MTTRKRQWRTQRSHPTSSVHVLRRRADGPREKEKGERKEGQSEVENEAKFETEDEGRRGRTDGTGHGRGVSAKVDTATAAVGCYTRVPHRLSPEAAEPPAPSRDWMVVKG